MGIHYEDIDYGAEENSVHRLVEYATAISSYENTRLFDRNVKEIDAKLSTLSRDGRHVFLHG